MDAMPVWSRYECTVGVTGHLSYVGPPLRTFVSGRILDYLGLMGEGSGNVPCLVYTTTSLNCWSSGKGYDLASLSMDITVICKNAIEN